MALPTRQTTDRRHRLRQFLGAPISPFPSLHRRWRPTSNTDRVWVQEKTYNLPSLLEVLGKLTSPSFKNFGTFLASKNETTFLTLKNRVALINSSTHFGGSYWCPQPKKSEGVCLLVLNRWPLVTSQAAASWIEVGSKKLQTAANYGCLKFQLSA